jgi:hypothetical protein
MASLPLITTTESTRKEAALTLRRSPANGFLGLPALYTRDLPGVTGTFASVKRVETRNLRLGRRLRPDNFLNCDLGLQAFRIQRSVLSEYGEAMIES